MFGGVAFMVDGSMVCAVSPRGAMVRVNRAEQDELVVQDGVERMVMGERTSRTWVSVAPGVLADDAVNIVTLHSSRETGAGGRRGGTALMSLELETAPAPHALTYLSQLGAVSWLRLLPSVMGGTA